MKCIFSVLLLVGCLAGCNEPTIETMTVTSRELWKSYNIHDYTIEQTRSCFCPYGGEKMKVTVVSDTVLSVVRMTDGVAISFPASSSYLSIDSLFGLINYSKADSIVVAYDAKYGFPKKVDIDPQLHPVDGGVLFETGNLIPKNQ